jgi:hypothetical protein
VPVIGSGGQTVNVAGQAAMRVQAAVVRIVGGSVEGATGGAIYYDSSIAVQPWVQTDADFGVSSAVTAHGHVTRTGAYWADATITFYSTVDVTTPGTGQPRFYVREFIRSFDADFSGWQWGWNNPVARCPVNGLIGGLPFVGFVDNDAFILDADGNAISRVLQTGDWLAGTVTGVFQND